jgi:arsenate reductase
MSPRNRVLILCTGNSARSQMAAGFLRSFDNRLGVLSAGTHPAGRVNPYAIAAMKEVGIDISAETPANVSRYTAQPFDYIITVCDDADRNCPTFSGNAAKRIHIGFIDPAAATGSEEQILDTFRRVRDQIKAKLLDFYNNEISK